MAPKVAKAKAAPAPPVGMEVGQYWTDEKRLLFILRGDSASKTFEVEDADGYRFTLEQYRLAKLRHVIPTVHEGHTDG